MTIKIHQMAEDDLFKLQCWEETPEYRLCDLQLSDPSQTVFLPESYYVVKDEQERLLGFFCYGLSAQIAKGNEKGFYEDLSYLDIGLGLNPLLCGRGHGAEFLEVGLIYAKNTFNVHKFRLTVPSFNKRAIKVYEKVGFKSIGSFEIHSKLGVIELMVMCLTI